MSKLPTSLAEGSESPPSPCGRGLGGGGERNKNRISFSLKYMAIFISPGYARLAALIAKRREARKGQGPVLVLDAGDYSMGTAFAAATGGKNKAAKEIKEWQAIMDYLRTLPVKTKGELPVIPVDERAAEVRAIKEG